MADAAITAEALKTMKDTLVELSDKWETGVTMGRAFDLKGEVIGGRNHTACHAWVTNVYFQQCDVGGLTYTQGAWSRAMGKHARNFVVGTCHSKGRSKGICTAEAHEAIILWLASDDSPFHKYIINRDDKESLLKGGMLIMVGPDGATLAECMWLCKALRYGVEGSHALDVWKALYDGGVDPLFALYVATYVRSIKGATFGYSGAEGHSQVFTASDQQPYGGKAATDFESILKRTVNRFAPNTYAVFTVPKPNKSLCTTGSVDTIRSFCKPVKKDDGWGGTVSGEGAERADFVSRVLAWQQELQAKIDNKKIPKPSLPTSSTVFLDVDM